MSALTPPASAVVGSSITVANTVRNRGGASAGPFRITFYLSASATPGTGTVLGFRDVTALAAAGATSAANTVLKIPFGIPAGAAFVSAVVDTGAAVSEVTEANNDRAAPITLTVQPDLLMSALTPPASASVGSSITVANTVRNRGGAGAGLFRITFYLSASATPGTGTILGFRDVTALAPGGVTSAANTVLAIPVGFPPGAAFISAVADTDGVVTEVTEGNNGRAAPITLVP
jgi:hypothetical protein